MRRVAAMAREAGLPVLDLALCMTVFPGFGGQAFRPEMMSKVKRAKDWRERNKPTLDIEVDGGINVATAKLSIESGANVNAKEKVKGETALTFAAAYGRADVIRVLTARGAETKATTTIRNTPSTTTSFRLCPRWWSGSRAMRT
jgi:pentose-5-phosphate-3-epimerase